MFKIKLIIMLKPQIEAAITGISGLGATEIAQQTIANSTDEASAKVNIIVQIIIGIATLLGLFRKKGVKNSKN